MRHCHLVLKSIISHCHIIAIIPTVIFTVFHSPAIMKSYCSNSADLFSIQIENRNEIVMVSITYPSMTRSGGS